VNAVPLNRKIGFFSGTYCVEWTYGKAVLVRKQLARALATDASPGGLFEKKAV
jgi:hypothetical protein